MSRRCPTCETSFSDQVFFCGHDGTITIEEQDPSDFDPRLGQQLGDYIVVARVADGAMGRVYEGRHPQTKARTAIKVLHGEVAKDAVAVERLKREFETAQMLDHPHVVSVLELGQTDDGSWFMTMEYLQGEELGKTLRRIHTMPKERLLRIASQVALALDHAHSFGVIHRDLKPDNVFLCESDEGDSVKILDFGSVKLQMEMGPKLTAYGTTLGSPYYMSPEQAMGKQDVDQRTDVFALAAIVYEMVTGKVAFEGSSVAEILMKIVNENPPPGSTSNPLYPPSLDDVIEQGLSKDKTGRQPSTVALAGAVGEALGLGGAVEQWARMPVAELAAQLEAAQPPAPQPFAGGQAPAAVLPPAVHDVSVASRRMAAPALLLGLALLGLVAMGGMAVAAYLLFT